MQYIVYCLSWHHQGKGGCGDCNILIISTNPPRRITSVIWALRRNHSDSDSDPDWTQGCAGQNPASHAIYCLLSIWYHQGKGRCGDWTQGCTGQNPASHAVHCLLSVFGTIRARVGVVTGPKAVLDRIQLHMQASVMHASGVAQVRSGSPFCSLCYYCLSIWLFCSLLSPVSFYSFFIVLSPWGNCQLTWC